MDYSGINPNGPGRFRKKQDNLVQQTCYFNVKNTNQLFNVFISKRAKNNEISEDNIHFQIERVTSRTKSNNKTFDAKLKLESLIKNGARILNLLNTTNTKVLLQQAEVQTEAETQSQQDLDFLLSDDINQKKKKKKNAEYSIVKFKARNFLTH